MREFDHGETIKSMKLTGFKDLEIGEIFNERTVFTKNLEQVET